MWYHERYQTRANKQHQSDSNLAKSLLELQVTIANQDEKDGIKLGQMCRKFFGYIQLCNIKPDLNIVLFNEALVRHKLSARHIIYIDATGNLFAKETPYNRLLYYTMILRSPYPKNTPIPIVMKIEGERKKNIWMPRSHSCTYYERLWHGDNYC